MGMATTIDSEAIFAKLPSDWKEQILSMMGDGASRPEVLVALGLTRRQHAILHKDCQEYKDAMDHGDLLAEAWWNREGRSNLGNKNYNNTMYIITVKARFGWNDRAPAGPNGEKPVPDKTKQEELREKYKVSTVGNTLPQ